MKEDISPNTYKKGCSVLIPAYNEEKNIASVINLTRKYIDGTILVIDDGSMDHTAEIARTLGAEVIVHHKNRGKGYGIVEGLAYLATRSTATYIIALDADLQHDPADIVRFLSVFEHDKCDIITGVRKAETLENMMPFLRFLSNFVTSHFVRVFFNLPCDDIQCGYRAYRADAVRRFLPYLRYGRKFDLETEILLIAWSLRLTIRQVQVKMIYGEFGKSSRIKAGKDTLRWLILVFRIMFDGRTYTNRNLNMFR